MELRFQPFRISTFGLASSRFQLATAPIRVFHIHIEVRVRIVHSTAVTTPVKSIFLLESNSAAPE